MLQETKLSTTNVIGAIDGYTLLRKDRHQNGGAAGLLIRNDLRFTPIAGFVFAGRLFYLFSHFPTT
jgi:hypothetical protein